MICSVSLSVLLIASILDVTMPCGSQVDTLGVPGQGSGGVPGQDHRYWSLSPNAACHSSAETCEAASAGPPPSVSDQADSRGALTGRCEKHLRCCRHCSVCQAEPAVGDWPCQHVGVCVPDWACCSLCVPFPSPTYIAQILR